MACDGVWDVMTDEEAVKLVANETNPFKACLTLRDYAYMYGSSDNISIIIVRF